MNDGSVVVGVVHLKGIHLLAAAFQGQRLSFKRKFVAQRMDVLCTAAQFTAEKIPLDSLMI